MSDAHSETPEAPLAKLTNTLLNLGVPAFLVAMLGVMGFFFVSGMGDTKEEREESQRLMAEAAAAEQAAAAAAAGGSPAPAPGGAGGAKPAAADGGVSPDVMALGKSTYATCAACHGPDGQGIQAGPAKMAPTLTSSTTLISSARLTSIVPQAAGKVASSIMTKPLINLLIIRRHYL